MPDATPLGFGFDTPEVGATFAVDTEARTISGLAVPWDVVGKHGGQSFTFSRGSLAWSEVSRVKLLIQHDRSQAVGKAVELTETDQGLFSKFKVARGDDGDKALALAEDGVYDGLSIGLSGDAQFSRKGNIMQSNPGNQLVEISLTPSPAFDDARVSAVVAEADTGRQEVMGNEETATAPVFDMDAMATMLAEKLQHTGVPAREVIPNPNGDVAGTATVQVTEATPYRFDRSGTLVRGSHEFANDLRDGLQRGDNTAYHRALSFIQGQWDSPTFAVQTTDVAGLNPNVQRPDLYVDQRKFQYPLWEAVRKGTLDEITPIVLPKWSSHSGLVAAHTQGTEPTPGAFAVTTETVTPAAVSGKVEITREVWDQGGAAASALIWSKMVQSYFEALEAIVVTELDAESPGATITLTTAAADSALSGEIAAAFADLQYVRGGFAFDVLALQVDLYKKLVAAKDGSNRPLFPILGPTNAPGSAQPRYARLNVHGVDGFPAWALAATGSIAANSYLFDREAVYAVASAPDRLEFQSLVKQVELAIWGYRVCEVIDNPGVRRVVYDPV